MSNYASYDYSSRGNSIQQDKASTGYSKVRRQSVEERARDILKRNEVRASSDLDSSDAGGGGSDLQSTYEALLKGIDIKSLDPPPMESPEPALRDRSEFSMNRSDSFGSPFGESFELSAADLEVGTIASKRMKERTAERGRRMSFDQTGQREFNNSSNLLYQTKISSSPDLNKGGGGKRNSQGDREGVYGSVLSSIPKSRSFSALEDRYSGGGGTNNNSHSNLEDYHINRKNSNFGSTDQSAQDYFQLLNVTNNTNTASQDTRGNNNNQSNTFSLTTDNNNEQANTGNGSDSEYYDDFELGENNLSASHSPLPTAPAAANATTTRDSSSPPLAPSQPVPLSMGGSKSSSSNTIIATATAAPTAVPTVPAANGLPSFDRMTSVEEIMQRWYTADDTELLKSLDTIGNKGTGSSMSLPSSPAVQPIHRKASLSFAEPKQEEKKMEDKDTAAVALPVVTREKQKPYDNDDNKNDVRDDEGEGRLPPIDASKEQQEKEEEQPVKMASSIFSIPTWAEEDVAAAKDEGQGEGEEEVDPYVDERFLTAIDESHYNREVDKSNDKSRPSSISTPESDASDKKKSYKSLNHRSQYASPAVRLDQQEESTSRHTQPSLSLPLYVSSSAEEDMTGDDEEEAVLLIGTPLLPVESDSPDHRPPREEQPYKLAPSIAKKIKKRGTITMTKSQQSQPQQSSSIADANKKPVASSTTGKSMSSSYSLIKSATVRAGAGATTKKGDEAVSHRASSAASAAAITIPTVKSSSRNTNATGQSSSTSQSQSQLQLMQQTSTQILREAIAMRAPLTVRRTSDNHDEEEDGRLAAAISLDLMRSKQRLLEQEFALEQQKQSLSHKERLLQVKEEIVQEQQTRLSQQQSQSEADNNQALISAIREQAALQQDLVEAMKVIESQRKDITGLHLQLSTAQQLVGLSHHHGDGSSAAVNVEELLVSRKRAFDALQDILGLLQQERQERTIAARTNANRPPRTNIKAETVPSSLAAAVDKTQLETLMQDLLQQERLLSSYEKENDRLSLLLKQQEGEFKGKEMLLQERCVELNKQVNSLQNKLRESGVILTAVGKEGQASNLRKELNLDAAIKDLQEKLYSLKKEHSQKERELITTIDSLREDNTRLIKANSALKATEAEDLRRVLTQREQEIAALRAKIDWFVDNQQVMSQLEGKLADMMAMKKNLCKVFVSMSGMNAEQVEMIARTGKPPTANSNDHNSSMFGGLQSPSQGRSFADIKKIKELEQTIRDLREVMAKRFPDSVAGLIQASKVVDSKQEEQQRSLRQRINELEAGLSEAAAGYEQKLRLLRLDYERLQAGSKQTIEGLHSQLKAASSAATNNNNAYRGSPSSTAGYAIAIEDWSHRQEMTEMDPANRIKELEVENQRLRTFYRRKLEEAQSRFDNIFRKIKRGETTDAEESGSSSSNSNGAAIKVLKDRLSLLEQELLLASEGLGQWKGRAMEAEHKAQRLEDEMREGNAATAAAVLDNNKGGNNGENVLPSSAVSSSRRQNVAVETDYDLDQLPSPPATTSAVMPAQLQSPQVSSSQEQREQVEKKYHQLQQQLLEVQEQRHEEKLHWLADKHSLLQTLQEEKNKNNFLSSEIEALKRALSLAEQQQQQQQQQQRNNGSSVEGKRSLQQQNSYDISSPKSITQVEFETLVALVSDLERRLDRRDEDWRRAMDSARLAHQAQINQMQSEHGEGLRLKDEQLLKFRRELEELVTELQHQHNISQQQQAAASAAAVY